jgi:hypothetical protein
MSKDLEWIKDVYRGTAVFVSWFTQSLHVNAWIVPRLCQMTSFQILSNSPFISYSLDGVPACCKAFGLHRKKNIHIYPCPKRHSNSQSSVQVVDVLDSGATETRNKEQFCN